MTKNGVFFISIVKKYIPSIWDPSYYRANGQHSCLGDYVTVTKISSKHIDIKYSSLFDPIEYRHIPSGKYMTFMLEYRQDGANIKYPMIGEQQILMGTMRAYLGNILVTPMAEWIGCKSPLFFPVKSEFVTIITKDDCAYFWWAYLRSPNFLSNLPQGSGGTRPRMHEDALLQTPVSVPDVEIRKAAQERLKECAEHEWRGYIKRINIIKSMNL